MPASDDIIKANIKIVGALTRLPERVCDAALDDLDRARWHLREANRLLRAAGREQIAEETATRSE